MLLQHRRALLSTTAAALFKNHVKAFEGILGHKHVLQQDLERFNTDWTQQFRGRSQLVLQPTCTEQVAAVMRYCSGNRLPVVPQGGNTGLVGGSIPLTNEIILSMSKMNQILELQESERVIKLECGVVLHDAEMHCREYGLTMPLDLGSKGSCQIGGNLSTNAGGIRFIRFGSLRSNCLGLQVVLANGEVLDSMRTLRKDNVGYDLKQLFIGSEGTLGVITQAAIMVHPKPQTSQVMLFGVQRFEDCVEILQQAKRVLGSSLSAFEYFDHTCLFQQRNPLSSEAKFYVLMECIVFSAEEEELMMSKLEQLLDVCKQHEAIMSQNEKQYREIWDLRELITTKLRATPTTHVFKYDVSIPSKVFNLATNTVKQRVEKKHPKLKVFQYGHLGDGNLHFNATIDLQGSTNAAEESKQIQREVEHELYAFVQQHQGSISAEHGLGQLKASKILKSRTPNEVAWMKQIKSTLDPHGLLNPGKVLEL